MTSTLRAFYDLKVSPCTFDVVTFLYLADMYRAHRGLESMELIVVANDEGDGFRGDARHLIELDDEIWVLHHVLLRAGTLFPACRTSLFCPDRSEASRIMNAAEDIYPISYSLSSPKPHYLQSHIAINTVLGYPLSALQAPAAASQRMKMWLKNHCGDRLPVAITLRELDFHDARNSDLQQWGDFARSLDQERYCPVILRDTARTLEPTPPALSQLLRCDIAATDVELRMALYELAHICLFVDNGPLILARLNPCVRYIIAGLGTGAPIFTERYLRKLGITSSYLSFPTTNYQRNLFGVPTFDLLREEFLSLDHTIKTEPMTSWTLERLTTTWMERFANAGAYAEAAEIYRSMAPTVENLHNWEREFREIIEKSVMTFHTSGDKLDALAGRRFLHEHFPENATYLILLIQDLISCQQFDEALDLADRLPHSDGTDRINEMLLRIAAKLPKLHRKYAARVDAHPNDYHALIRYAEILYHADEFDRATVLLDCALKIIPIEDIQARMKAKTLLGL